MKKKARMVELVNGSVWLYVQRTIFTFDNVAKALEWCALQNYEVIYE